MDVFQSYMLCPSTNMNISIPMHIATLPTKAIYLGRSHENAYAKYWLKKRKREDWNDWNVTLTLPIEEDSCKSIFEGSWDALWVILYFKKEKKKLCDTKYEYDMYMQFNKKVLLLPPYN